MIVDPSLIHIDQFLGRLLGQLSTELLPQLLLAFGVAKGLFLCG
jgi:hypothetical protein